MSLPVKFKNVHYYRITGRYTFAGDLFVARGAIYYFPEVDLAEQRRRSFEYAPDHFGLIAWAVVSVMQKVNSYVPRHNLWEEGMPDEQFQKKANAYIEAMKEMRRGKSFSETLPVPLRVGASEISDLKFSATGRLSFLAQSDSHDFNVGLMRKRRLREALWEGGLGRV
jgi:hypothetical protein